MCVLIRALLTAGVSAYFQGNFAKLSPPLAVACDFQLLKGALSSPLMESAGIPVTSFSLCSDLKNL